MPTRNISIQQQFGINEGFQIRHVQKTDPEVIMYDQAVSSANESDGFPSHPYVIWRWVAPATTSARWFNENLVILKLADSSGTELSETAKILFGFKVPDSDYVEYFASAPYALWKRVALENQGHRDYNEALFVPFDPRKFGNQAFIEIGPQKEFIVAVANSSTLVDKDHANTVVEVDLAVKSS